LGFIFYNDEDAEMLDWRGFWCHCAMLYFLLCERRGLDRKNGASRWGSEQEKLACAKS
jgi:hypothetical protein